MFKAADDFVALLQLSSI